MKGKEKSTKLDTAKDVVSAVTESAAGTEAPKEAAGTEDVEAKAPKAEAQDAQDAGAEDAPKAKRGTRAKKAKEEEKPEAKPVPKKLKDELRPEVCIQFGGQQASVDDMVQKVKEQHIAEGHRAGNIKSLRLYVKPEDGAVYYVINEKHDGKVDLF